MTQSDNDKITRAAPSVDKNEGAYSKANQCANQGFALEDQISPSNPVYGGILKMRFMLHSSDAAVTSLADEYVYPSSLILAFSWATRSFFSTLPMGLFGSSSRNSTACGTA